MIPTFEQYIKETLDFSVTKTLYHGTNKTTMLKLKKGGFDDRYVMFTDDINEAKRYAHSYCLQNMNKGVIKIDSPAIVTIDSSSLRILSLSSYKAMQNNFDGAVDLAKKDLIDGVLSDDTKSNYFVIFNTQKLNSLIKNNCVKFQELPDFTL